MDAQEWRQTRDALLEVVDTQKRQLAQMARMLEIQRQEHEQTREGINQAQASLLAGARALGEGGERLGQEVMHALGSQGRQRMSEALGQPLEDAKKGIDLAARRITQSGELAARQMEGLARSQRALVRVSLVWLGVGGMFLLLGTSLWAWQMGRQARQHSVEADLGARIGQADLVKCGVGLCANVDISVRGQGDRQQYRPVRVRSEAGETP
ncbi:hypothetical protein J2X02_000520 [Pseudoxanthomonas japonensis]|uniref:hypothetical protein n=1 Tax=Pseudoxanthomonas japonensis TaxID=69284 RepID=UPI002854F476|nr:hypothetical protein [Pseudoxanthomonas japonensis]MDR7067703.1 hypothetical protein [Pseudoxanthomonas japonensis]